MKPKQDHWYYWLAGFLACYVASFLYTSANGVPGEDIVIIFFTVGLGFSVIGWVLSRKATVLQETKPKQRHEGLVVLAIVVYISLLLIRGSKPIRQLLPGGIGDTQPYLNIIVLVWKLVVFVLIPFGVYRLLYGFKWSDFGLSGNGAKVFARRNVIIFVVMSLMVVAFNYFLGNGARPLREGAFSGGQIAIGIVLSLLWLVLEVGLVEEFFFRALLQERLAKSLKSEWGGIVVGSIIFGIVHAPGMYYRGAGVIEGLGGAPNFMLCISYCIVVQAVVSVSFGIIWSRTKNLWLLMGIHVMTDVVPSLAPFIEDWGL